VLELPQWSTVALPQEGNKRILEGARFPSGIARGGCSSPGFPGGPNPRLTVRRPSRRPALSSAIASCDPHPRRLLERTFQLAHPAEIALSASSCFQIALSAKICLYRGYTAVYHRLVESMSYGIHLGNVMVSSRQGFRLSDRRQGHLICIGFGRAPDTATRVSEARTPLQAPAGEPTAGSPSAGRPSPP
jgi:hypothetical protein